MSLKLHALSYEWDSIAVNYIYTSVTLLRLIVSKIVDSLVQR
jgi:hypothetical protein